jgi:hypothetical protein
VLSQAAQFFRTAEPLGLRVALCLLRGTKSGDVVLSVDRKGRHCGILLFAVVAAVTTWITPAGRTSKRIRAGMIPGEGIAMNSEIFSELGVSSYARQTIPTW